MNDSIEVVCPCCQQILTVDLATKKVLGHQAAPSRAATFDLASEVNKLKQSKAASDQKFSEAIAGHRRQQEGLSRRFDDLFEKAKSKADEPPPVRDIDL